MCFGRPRKRCPKVSEAVAKTRRKIECVSEGLGSRARRFRKQLRKKSVGRRLPFESGGRNTSEALRKLRVSYFSRLGPIFEGGPFAARVRGEAVAKKVDKSMCFGRPRKLSPKVRGSSSEEKKANQMCFGRPRKLSPKVRGSSGEQKEGNQMRFGRPRKRCPKVCGSGSAKNDAKAMRVGRLRKLF